jgi:hypothetical protein
MLHAKSREDPSYNRHWHVGSAGYHSCSQVDLRDLLCRLSFEHEHFPSSALSCVQNVASRRIGARGSHKALQRNGTLLRDVPTRSGSTSSMELHTMRATNRVRARSGFFRCRLNTCPATGRESRVAISRRGSLYPHGFPNKFWFFPRSTASS